MCNADIDEIKKRHFCSFIPYKETSNYQHNEEIKQKEFGLESKQEITDQENRGFAANRNPESTYKVVDTTQSQEQGESNQKFDNATVRTSSHKTSLDVEESKDNSAFSSQNEEVTQFQSPEVDDVEVLMETFGKLTLEEPKEGKDNDEHYTLLKNQLKKLVDDIEKSTKYNQLTQDKLLKFRETLDNIVTAGNKLPRNHQKRLEERVVKFNLQYKELLNSQSEMRAMSDNRADSSAPRENLYESDLPNRLHKLKAKPESNKAQNVHLEPETTHCTTISYEKEVKGKTTINKVKNMPEVHGYQQNNPITEQEKESSIERQSRNRVENRSQMNGTYNEESLNLLLRQRENTKNVDTQNVKPCEDKRPPKDGKHAYQAQNTQTRTEHSRRQSKEELERRSMEYQSSKKQAEKQEEIFDDKQQKQPTNERKEFGDGDKCRILCEKLKKLNKNVEETIKFNQLTKDKALIIRKIFNQYVFDRNILPPYLRSSYNEMLLEFYSRYAELINNEFEIHTPALSSFKASLQDHHQHRASMEAQHIIEHYPQRGRQIQETELQGKNFEAANQHMTSERTSRGPQPSKGHAEQHDKGSSNYQQNRNEGRCLGNYNYNLQHRYLYRPPHPQPQFVYQNVYEHNIENNRPVQEKDPQLKDIEIAEEVVMEEPIEILDVHQYFADFDLTSLNNSVDAITQVKTIEEWAKAFEDKVTTFSGERYSLEYFVIDEKLMRLIEELDKLKCQDDEAATTKKIAVIQDIKKLQNILDTKAKDA